MNYTPYHVHTQYSINDSVATPQEYIDIAVKNGMKAICFSEHGNIFNWCDKLARCNAAGIKYIHGCEVYLAEELYSKRRDQFHAILIAKNMDGLRELNTLLSNSYTAGHLSGTKGKNRITFDEFLNISDNIISTSACLAGPLSKLPRDHPRYMEMAKKFTFLEIQPHNVESQKAYNKELYELSLELGKPLIAGTDSHYYSEYTKNCRKLVQHSRSQFYDEEDQFDMGFKTYEELVDAFKKQAALPEDVYLQAIENTNVLMNMTEEIVIDTKTIKYPISYGSPAADAEKLREMCRTKLVQKINNKIIPASQKDAFIKAVAEELDIFEKLGMGGFMLSMAELMSYIKDNNLFCGFARGSVGGSRVAYVTDITDVNPETWNTVFSRFCNENRVEVGDIDIDITEVDRPKVIQYLVDKFGEDKVSKVITFGTMQERDCIKTIGRGLCNEWKETHPHSLDKNPWRSDNVDRIVDAYINDPEKAKRNYPDLFYYMDGLLGKIKSRGVHAGGQIVSPMSLPDNYGTIIDDEGNTTICLDMDVCHDVQLVKYDLLVTKTTKVIKEAYDYAGIPYPKSHEVDWNDEKVWEDIRSLPYGIFQFEKPYATQCLRDFNAKSIADMSIICAAIRPSGASYRDALVRGTRHKNPSPIIDNLLKENNGYLVYQEDIIQFLQEICGLSGSEADTIRRGIAKKQSDVLEAALPKIMDGYCEKSDKPREVAEKEAKEFLQVIQDSSSYMFNKNHSIAYCMISYICGWLRYYYPCEFITAFLDNAKNNDDIINGSMLAAKKGISLTMPKWGISRAGYFFNKERNTISTGIKSLKNITAGVAEQLYELSCSRKFDTFVEVLIGLKSIGLKANQITTLIDIDFFSEFGNQRELQKIFELFVETFKYGTAKKIKRDKVDGSPLQEIVDKYSTSTTKEGKPAASYTITDMDSILIEMDRMVHEIGIGDVSLAQKARKYNELAGYPGYTTFKESDRPKLLVIEVKPARRRVDGKLFGYNIKTKSIGSGKESRFTIAKTVFMKTPIKTDDVIFCPNDGFYHTRDNYFNLRKYEKIT